MTHSTNCFEFARWSLISLVTLSWLTAGGCSNSLSQKNLAQYAIDRGGDDEEEESQLQPPAVDAPPQAVQTPSPLGTPVVPTSAAEQASNSTTPVGTAPVSGETSQLAQQDNQPSAATVAIGELIPIDQRKPAQQLSDTERRRRGIQNLEATSRAVQSWLGKRGTMPFPVIKNSRGQAVLSWRVQILPLLGYHDLYAKFDLEQSWDSEHNKKLLPFIPEEYVSPERFDENTNIQLLVGAPGVFSLTENLYRAEITDGNVLMMAEVDDQAAVPWTAPGDLSIERENFSHSLGNLREEGTFVAWYDGTVSVWRNPLRSDELLKALTYDRGDRFVAEPHLQFPQIELQQSFAIGGGGTASASRSIDKAMNTVASSTAGPGDVASLVRLAVPSREKILEAEQKVRATYQDQFTSARSTAELAALADRMVEQLTTGSAPAEDRLVGLRTALNIAIKAHDPDKALKIVDQIVTSFDVPREDYVEIAINGFLGEGGTLRTEANKAITLLPTIESLVESQLVDDDVRRAESTVKMTSIVLRTVSDRETVYRWKVLQERVSESKRLLPRVIKHLETLEENPDDPIANETVGWYLCLIKNEWDEGMALLAKGKQQELRELAQVELQQQIDPEAIVKLADQWWDYAVQHKDETLAMEGALKRARKWYRSAALGLSDGLDRIRANDRQLQIDRMIGADPDSVAVPERSL